MLLAHHTHDVAASPSGEEEACHDAGPRDKGAERMCIVTRETGPKDTLVRFVAGPDGRIVADIEGKLPGRGCWVKAEAAVLAQAVQKQLFSRALKTKAPGKTLAGPELVEQTGKRLHARALSLLSLSRRAGLLVQGFEQVETLLRSGEAACIIHASDAAANGIAKLAGLVAARHIPAIACFSRDALAEALGIENPVHLALLPGGLSKSFAMECRRFAGFSSGTGV